MQERDWDRFNSLFSLDARMVHTVLFFFQAEDGIRYLTVTGVQTCALPICSSCSVANTMAAPSLRPANPARARDWPTSGSPSNQPRSRASGAPSPAVRTRRGDRKSVVKGKSVDLGGRRIIKKKKHSGLHTRH